MNRTFAALGYRGFEQTDGRVKWFDRTNKYSGTTRNGEGYEVIGDGEPREENAILTGAGKPR